MIIAIRRRPVRSGVGTLIGSAGRLAFLLTFTFPISRIYALSCVSDTDEGVRIVDINETVLDTTREAFIELVPKGGHAPTGIGGKLVERNQVGGQMVRVLHTKISQLILGFANRVIG